MPPCANTNAHTTTSIYWKSWTITMRTAWTVTAWSSICIWCSRRACKNAIFCISQQWASIPSVVRRFRLIPTALSGRKHCWIVWRRMWHRHQLLWSRPPPAPCNRIHSNCWRRSWTNPRAQLKQTANCQHNRLQIRNRLHWAWWHPIHSIRTVSICFYVSPHIKTTTTSLPSLHPFLCMVL